MSFKSNGPWKIKKSIEKYKNPWIRVTEDQVICPDGKDGIFGLVKIKNGVSILPIDKNGFVYLVKQFRYTLGKETIEVSSGGIDKNESPLEAAKRELEEELGIIAQEWINFGLIDPFTTIVQSNVTLFLAKNLSFTKTNHEGTEKMETLKVKFKDALKMVNNGEITASDSCILILKVAEYLKK